MNCLIILSCLAVAALSAPLEGEQLVDVTQDTLGNYKVLVKTANLFKTEERFPDGSVIGEYSYPDANGVLQTFKYTSGVGGFQLIEGPVPVAPVDFNVPVPEDAELIAARNQHLALLRVAVPEIETPIAPVFNPVVIPAATPAVLPTEPVVVFASPTQQLVLPNVPTDVIDPGFSQETVLPTFGIVNPGVAPVQVLDTPEVLAAKAEHFAAVAAARALVG